MFADPELSYDEKLNYMRNCLKLVLDYARIITENHNTIDFKQIDEDAHLLLKMCLVRTISLVEFTKGIDITNDIDGKQIKLLDPLTSFGITRSVLESYCNFNNIYCQSNTEELKQLKYDLWCLSGLKYRQSFAADSKVNQQKKIQEAKNIEELIENIYNNTIYTSLESVSQSNIKKAIGKKQWQLVVNNKKAHIVGWQELLYRSGANKNLDSQYTYLSLITHPSNVSVFQFHVFSERNEESRFMYMAINVTLAILSMFIEDYLQYFPKAQNILINNEKVKAAQDLISRSNNMFRGTLEL